MNLKALIAASRIRLDDATAPFLWSDDEIALYLSEAEREAATRALLIEDRETPAYCTVAVRAGVSRYKLHRNVLKIERAKLDAQKAPLSKVTRKRLDETLLDWDKDSGAPERFIDDEQYIVLHPTPVATDTLRLTVRRLPKQDFTAKDKSAEPEIHERHHFGLIDWVARCAYLKPDTDTYNPDRSKAHEAAFERAFGAREDADVQRKKRERRVPIVRYGGL